MNIEVIRSEPNPPPVEKIVLELMPDEAVLIGALLGGADIPKIDQSLRPMIYQMYNVMVDAGFGWAVRPEDSSHPSHSRHTFVYDEARKLVR